MIRLRGRLLYVDKMSVERKWLLDEACCMSKEGLPDDALVTDRNPLMTSWSLVYHSWLSIWQLLGRITSNANHPSLCLFRTLMS